MATEDYGNCDVCGKSLSEDDDFSWRADAINAALEDADDLTTEALLAMFVGRYISRFVAEDHKRARRGIARGITRETKRWVIAGCDA